MPLVIVIVAEPLPLPVHAPDAVIAAARPEVAVAVTLKVALYAALAGADWLTDIVWFALSTSKALLVPVLELTGSVTVIVLPVPAFVTVTLPVHAPLLKLPEAVGLIEPAVVLRLTVPLNPVMVLL